MNYIYIDFEYIEEPDRSTRHIICAVTRTSPENILFKWDFLNETMYIPFINYLKNLNRFDRIFVGFAIGGAEIPCLVQLMGKDWVKHTQWIDLWVEYKMWILTHPDFQAYAKKDSLKSNIECFGLEDKYLADKEDILSLILYDEENRTSKAKLRIHNNTFNYSEEEMDKILHYCKQDVLILHEIALKHGEICRAYEIPISREERLARGKFSMLSGISYACGNGFPMDAEKVTAIFSQRDKIKELIQKDCNQKISHEIYKPKFKGPQYRKTFVKYEFNHENFGKYITENNLADIWQKTDKGKQYRLDEDYLDEMLSSYKDILEPVYHARNTLKQLSSTNLASIMDKNGYIKTPPFPFHQKTSRSSPKPSLGFVLNLSPWLRMLLRPAPGRAFVSIDFKSQEVLIAAILSKDAQLLDSYLNDCYMSTAIKTGFAPEGATKKTHNHIRTPFKGISLGTLYGLQIKSLTFRFMALNKEWTEIDARQAAEQYFETHKEVYNNYWNFISNNYEDCMNMGYFRVDAESGWIYFMRRDTRSSQIQNLPCQSWGAEMMRYSHDDCVMQEIFVIPLHDALNFECAIEDAVRLAKQASKIMCEASARLLGYDYMSTETKIFTYEKPYYDSRGEETYRFIMNELNIEIPEKFYKPLEYENIHLLNEIVL